MNKIIYLIILSLGMGLLVTGCNSKAGENETETSEDTAKPPYKYDESKAITTQSGLKIIIVKEGTGAKPQPGDLVNVNYHGLLKDGNKFDSSFDRGEPFSFGLGKGQVIKGWDEGFAALKVGSKAVLIVPPDLAYGATERPGIPANSTLYFHVEFLGIKKPYEPFPYDEAKMQSTPSGIKYTIVEEGAGNAPVMGKSRIKMHIHAVTQEGQVLANSFDQTPDKPMSMLYAPGQLFKGWEESIALMKEGSKGVFIIPAEIGPNPEQLKSPLIMRISMEKVEEFVPFKPYAFDPSKLQKTASGLQYAVVEDGKGAKPKSGDKISVLYHGMLQDGKVFDSGFDRGEPIEITLGQGQVIKGWDEGLALLNRGTKAVFVIPGNLAYGEKGSPPNIPPNATLVFHVHLLEK